MPINTTAHVDASTLTNGETNGRLGSLKKNAVAESTEGSSRYWEKRYIPGQDESFEVSHLLCGHIS